MRGAALKKMRDEFAAHWRVENGELVNDGHGPYANTDKDLGDIEKTVFRVPTRYWEKSWRVRLHPKKWRRKVAAEKD
jgi:hypothetical protein